MRSKMSYLYIFWTFYPYSVNKQFSLFLTVKEQHNIFKNCWCVMKIIWDFQSLQNSFRILIANLVNHWFFFKVNKKGGSNSKCFLRFVLRVSVSVSINNVKPSESISFLLLQISKRKQKFLSIMRGGEGYLIKGGYCN